MSLPYTPPDDLHHFVNKVLRTDLETLRQFVAAPTRCLAARPPGRRRRRCPNRIRGNPQPVQYILDNPNASWLVHSYLLDVLARAAFCGFHRCYVRDLAEECRELRGDEQLVSHGICSREALPTYKEAKRKWRERRERRKLAAQAFRAVACVCLWIGVLSAASSTVVDRPIPLFPISVFLAILTYVFGPDLTTLYLSLIRLFSSWLDVARRRRSLGVPGDAPDAHAYFESKVLSYRFAIIRTYSGLHLTFRRRIPLGCQRAEWICTCGKPMFKDTVATNKVPQGYPYGSAGHSQQVASTAATGRTKSSQGAVSPGNHSSLLLGGGTGTANSPSPIGPSISGVTQQLGRAGSRRFLELCINTGGYVTSLGEIEISAGTSDGDLFDRICKKYRELRGRSYKRMLMHPVEVHYVKFNVHKKYRVGIRDKPVVLPPDEEVQNGNYAYLCPDLPPMDRNEFLHHFHRSAEDHPEAVYLERLPKKLGEPLCDVRTQYGARAWGVHIIEGPNRAALTWCCVAIEIISLLISIIFSATMHTQEQGFGIGSWILAVLATTLTALYFQWEKA